jgi:hypothetical protein
MTKRECELFFALIAERIDANGVSSARAIAAVCREALADERFARERRGLVTQEATT